MLGLSRHCEYLSDRKEVEAKLRSSSRGTVYLREQLCGGETFCQLFEFSNA